MLERHRSQFNNCLRDSRVELVPIARGTPYDQSLIHLDSLVSPDEPIIVSCCDNISPLRGCMPVLKEMLKRYDLILVTPKLNEWMGYGVVEVACGEVLAFKDSAQVAKDAEHHYIDGGISILKSGLIRRAQSFEGGFQAYIDKIMSEKKVASYIPDAWFDIGTPDAYRHTCASELFRNLFVKSKCISR